jgi:hypothetical protein
MAVLGRDFDRDPLIQRRIYMGDAEMYYGVIHGPNLAPLYYGVIQLDVLKFLPEFFGDLQIGTV